MYKCFFICLALLAITSCNDSSIAGDTMAIKGNSWNLKDVAVFDLPGLDSNKKYNTFITVRNNNTYPYSNLYLIVSLQYPHGKTSVDTLEYKMARPDGSWLGIGLGSIKESKLFYKENFGFNEEGKYILSITHAVRNNGEVQGVSSLEGITDIGYAIEELP